MPTEIYTLISSLLVAIVTARLTVRFSIAQFRAEKWWERKADAYDRILGALSDTSRYLNALADEQTGEGEASGELERQSSAAFHELARATAIGAYIISDEASKALERRAKHESPDYFTDPYGYYLSELRACEAALAEIRDEAKRDLQVGRK